MGGSEKIFDVEEYIRRATSFHEDKDRAEKLSTKMGYLNSLCSTLEEKVFFRAVYQELFPDDKVTIDLLDRLINGAFKEEKDEWMFQEIDTVEELDTFSKNLRKKVKAIIKQLQRHQLAQIERMRRKNREIREKEEKFIKDRDEKYNANVKDVVDKDKLLHDLKRLSVDDRRKLLAELGDNSKTIIQEKDLYGIKGLTAAQKAMIVGKTIEQLTPEIRRELGIDSLFRSAPAPDMRGGIGGDGFVRGVPSRGLGRGLGNDSLFMSSPEQEKAYRRKERDFNELVEGGLTRPPKRRHHELTLKEFENAVPPTPKFRKNLNKMPSEMERKRLHEINKEIGEMAPHLGGPPQRMR